MRTKNISTLEGTAGYVLAQHIGQLNSLASFNNPSKLSEFALSIMPEMNESAQQYMRDDFMNKVNEQSYMKSYHQLYNIYLAGISGCRVGSIR